MTSNRDWFPGPPSTSSSLHIEIRCPSQKISKTFGKASQAPTPRGLPPGGTENLFPTVQNQLGGFNPIEQPLITKPSSEDYEPNGFSQDSNQSGKGSKKRSTEVDTEPKNCRPRLSPSGSGDGLQTKSSSSHRSNKAKSKNDKKGKKYYQNCIKSADDEDVKYVRKTLEENTYGLNLSIVVPYYEESKRERFIAFILKLGFVVTSKGNLYEFDNKDLDQLSDAFSSSDNGKPDPSELLLPRSRSKSFQVPLDTSSTSYSSGFLSGPLSADSRGRSISSAPFFANTARTNRAGSEDGSDCGTPRTELTPGPFSDDYILSQQRSSTPHLDMNKMSLHSASSPRYGQEKGFAKPSSNTMTEISRGNSHKRNNSTGNNDTSLSQVLKETFPQIPSSIYQFPPTKAAAPDIGYKIGIASSVGGVGGPSKFPMPSSAVTTSAPVDISTSSTLAGELRENSTGGKMIISSSPPSSSSAAVAAVFPQSAFSKLPVPRRPSNTHIGETTPMINNMNKNSSFDHFVTPQAKSVFVARWLESVGCDGAKLEFFKNRLAIRSETMKITARVSKEREKESQSSAAVAPSLMNPAETQTRPIFSSQQHTIPFSQVPLTDDHALSFPGSKGSKLSYGYKDDMIRQQSSTEIQFLNDSQPFLQSTLPPPLPLSLHSADLGGGVCSLPLFNSSGMSLNSSSTSPRNHLLGEHYHVLNHPDNSQYVSDDEAMHQSFASHDIHIQRVNYHPNLSQSEDSLFTGRMGGESLRFRSNDLDDGTNRTAMLEDELELVPTGDTLIYNSPPLFQNSMRREAVGPDTRKQRTATGKRLSRSKMGKARRRSMHLGVDETSRDRSQAVLERSAVLRNSFMLGNDMTEEGINLDSPERGEMEERALSPIPQSQSPLVEEQSQHLSMMNLSQESIMVDFSSSNLAKRHLKYSLSPLQKSFQQEAEMIESVGILSPSLKGSLATATNQSSLFTAILRPFLLRLCDFFSDEELINCLSNVNKVLHIYSLQTVIRRKDIGASMLRVVGVKSKGNSRSNRSLTASVPHLWGWEQFVQYLSTHREGYFLGEGACKRVYQLQDLSTQQDVAVSIMDIEDMIARGMSEAVAKEVEITLLCSSLMKYRICPQMIRVHTLFQSQFDPSNRLWNRPKPSPTTGVSHGLRRGLSNAEFRQSGSWSSLSSSSLSTLEYGIAPSQHPSLPLQISPPPLSIEKKHCDKGSYQFVEMEFCSCGDLEEYIRSISLPTLEMVKSCLFQMFYSVYCGRVMFSLRHFDIKLLNFFLYKIPLSAAGTVSAGHHFPTYLSSATPSPRFAQPTVQRTPFSPSPGGSDYAAIASHQAMVIGFENYFYRLPFLPSNTRNVHDSFFLLVKLGDYGTSLIDSPLTTPITVQQFTTLENSPPEFLLLGSDRNCQDYAADTFNLGLCMLHLLTGEMPYEEILQDVHCPNFLAKKWIQIWSKDEVINEVIKSLIPEDSDQEGDNEEEDDVLAGEEVLTKQENLMEDSEGGLAAERRRRKKLEEANPFLILCNTLYRFLVLFAGSTTFTTGFVENPVYREAKIGRVILDTFGLVSDKQRANKSRDMCRLRFEEHAGLWSLHQGSHPLMIRTRQRINELGGVHAWQLLDSLLHWNPNARKYISTESIFFFPYFLLFFSCLRLLLQEERVRSYSSRLERWTIDRLSCPVLC